MAAKEPVKRPTSRVATPPGPDRDTGGRVRLQIIEDTDPQSGGTWQSFQIMSTIRVEDHDHFARLQRALNGEANAPTVVTVLGELGASPQLIKLYNAAKNHEGRGTGGVPNILFTQDYGGARGREVKGRFTIHTEVFLRTSDPDDIAQLLQYIGRSATQDVVDLLKSIGFVADNNALDDLLTAAFTQ